MYRKEYRERRRESSKHWNEALGFWGVRHERKLSRTAATVGTCECYVCRSRRQHSVDRVFQDDGFAMILLRAGAATDPVVKERQAGARDASAESEVRVLRGGDRVAQAVLGLQAGQEEPNDFREPNDSKSQKHPL